MLVLLVTALSLAGFPGAAQAQSGVDYDADNDGLIEISNVAQLDAIRYDLDGDGEADAQADGSTYAAAFHNAALGMGCPAAGCIGYELVADLDLRNKNWLPIGAPEHFGTGKSFQANFDGGNHTITNLRINRQSESGDDVGLFSSLDGGGSPNPRYVKRLGLTSIDVSATCIQFSCDAGGLASRVFGYTISDTYVTGSVTLNCNGGILCKVGGLIGGANTTEIVDSYSTSDVTTNCMGDDLACWIGGLVGSISYTSLITDSHSSADVSATCLGTDTSCDVGGLVGTAWESSNTSSRSVGISASHATGSVSVNCDNGIGDDRDSEFCDVGGLIGSGSGSGAVTASHATGDVSVSCDNRDDGCHVGGLIGFSRDRIVTASHATGDVNANCDDNNDGCDVGGLIGNGSGTVTTSYATGEVSIVCDSATNANCSSGGLIGYSRGVIATAIYAAGDVSATCGNRSFCAAGGMAGSILGGSINSGYATGYVSAACDNAGSPYCRAGGLAGRKFSLPVTVDASYWDTQTSGQAVWVGRSHDDDLNISGKTTAELQSPTGYTGIYASWNIDLDNADEDDNLATGGDDPWDFGTSSQYPMLRNVGTGTGSPVTTPVDYDGDDDGLIEISNLAQLDAIRYDLDGDGVIDSQADSTTYAAAFLDAATGMGCPVAGCTGYELIADLDFDTNGNGRADAEDAYWNDGAGWAPIGQTDYQQQGDYSGFTATFDGSDHTIVNLYIGHPSICAFCDVGLFGSNSGTVRNVGLLNVNVSGYHYIGGLVGSNFGVITASYVTGSVAGGYRVVTSSTGNSASGVPNKYGSGGLVAYNPGVINVIYDASPLIPVAFATGGLVGSNSGVITDSHATGSVTGESDTGGLVGSNFGAITGSYATGSVAAGYDGTGGLVGANYGGVIIASYATGSVTKGGGVGGLVGCNTRGVIVASYATGSVADGSYTGGLVGINNTRSPSCYGVRFHDDDGVIKASYWDTQTSGQIVGVGVGVGEGYATGASGKTTAELQSPTGYSGIYADWNVDLDNADGDDDPSTGGDDPWNFGTSSQYPTLNRAGVAGPGSSSATLGNPANLRVAAVGDGQVTLEWEAADNADTQWIAWYRVNGTDVLVDYYIAPGTWSQFIVTDLENGQLYAFVVTAARSMGGQLQFSEQSNRVEATPGYGPEPDSLTAPTNVVATVSGSSVTVTWTDGQGAVSHLVFLFRSDFSGDPTIVPGTGGSHTFPNIAPGGYIAVVVAVDASGDYQVGISGPATVAAANTSAATDRAALVALYNATDGPNWTNNDGWLSDAPIGEWHGVGTSDDGRVIILGLSSNGLTGTLPAELGNLSGLVWLDLDYNGLNGEIPAALGDLSGLTVLRLGSNELTGPIPTELGRLSNLAILGLGNNQLTGSIPSQLGNLSGLVRFSVWNNQLTGPIPPELGNLTELERLNLSANGLTGGIPSQLGDLNKLTVLELGSNRLTGEIPTQIGQLTNLLRLSLSNNQLTGEIPSELGMLTDLVELHLWENRLSGPIPVELGGLTDLKALNLGDNQLSGNIPARLGNLADLETLDLGNNQLDGAIPSELGEPDMTTASSSPALSFGYENPWNGALYHEISYELPIFGGRQRSGAVAGQQTDDQRKNLKVLDLRKNLLIGPIPQTLRNLPKLKKLYLHNNRLKGQIPTFILKLFVRNLEGNPGLGRSVTPSDNPDEAGIRKDKAALRALYNATKGQDNWLNKDGWNTNAPLADWHGVTTDEETDERNPTGRVVRLELPQNRLCGTIPSDLGDLTELTHLDLSYNSCSARGPDTPGLQEGIPTTLGNLTKLEELNLSGNRLSGNIPSSLGNLAALEELDLSHNRRKTGLGLFGKYFDGLEGNVPTELSKLNNLTTLKLNNNLLTGDVADVLYLFEEREGHEERDGSKLVVDVSNNKFEEDKNKNWNSLKGNMEVEPDPCPLGWPACKAAQGGLKVLKFTSDAGGGRGKWLFRYGTGISFAYTVVSSHTGQQIINGVIRGEPLEEIIEPYVNEYATGPLVAFGCALAGQDLKECASGNSKLITYLKTGLSGGYSQKEIDYVLCTLDNIGRRDRVQKCGPIPGSQD